MPYLFLLIGLIAGTLTERYILPVFDLILTAFSNNKQLQAMGVKRNISAVENKMALEAIDTQYEATLIEKDILDIRAQSKSQETNIIGYHMDEKHPEEDDEDWDDDCKRCEPMGYKSPNENKIGF